MKRFVKEYATYLLKGLESNDLMRAEIKQQKQEQIERTLKAYQRNLITVCEAMKTLTDI